jgi:hypothetical protein
MCPTAQTYQDHQSHQGVEGAGLGGLYTRIVINDFLPQYPGRAPFQPGPSEYGAAVESPFILIPLCFWYAVMYIASRASSLSSCVLPRTKAFSHQNVTANRLTSRLSKQTSQSKS